ncbi:unnamed protein product [Pleuronectes platessa]|uniref:Uncharacterized protein n=1 Tax=Pleuronectes platessa TaxID=8262 RepID=A0A9N7YBK3_PLEPL|nr:unnamed protein product [Pleuronectes platessa]
MGRARTAVFTSESEQMTQAASQARQLERVCVRPIRARQPLNPSILPLIHSSIHPFIRRREKAAETHVKLTRVTGSQAPSLTCHTCHAPAMFVYDVGQSLR